MRARQAKKVYDIHTEAVLCDYQSPYRLRTVKAAMRKIGWSRMPAWAKYVRVVASPIAFSERLSNA